MYRKERKGKASKGNEGILQSGGRCIIRSVNLLETLSPVHYSILVCSRRTTRSSETSFCVLWPGESVRGYEPLSPLCTRIVFGGTSELGLIGSVRESREDESEPLQIGSCWCEWGSGREPDDDVLARDAKNPPNVLVLGGGAGAALTAAGAEAVDKAGDDTGVGFVVVALFQSLKPHLEDTDPLRVTPGACFVDAAAGGSAGAGAAFVPGGCMPMLFSSMNVRRALTQVSDASCASRASVSSCRVSSSWSLIAESSFLTSSSSEASSVGGRSGGVGLARPKNPDRRRELPPEGAGCDCACALTSCSGSSCALRGGLARSLW